MVVAISVLLNVLAYADQARRNSAQGILTAFEDGNTVAIIDNKGYFLASNILIFDKLGRKATVEALELPAPVYIEFSYDPRGVIVHLLKVTPR